MMLSSGGGGGGGVTQDDRLFVCVVVGACNKVLIPTQLPWRARGLLHASVSPSRSEGIGC